MIMVWIYIYILDCIGLNPHCNFLKTSFAFEKRHNVAWDLKYPFIYIGTIFFSFLPLQFYLLLAATLITYIWVLRRPQKEEKIIILLHEKEVHPVIQLKLHYLQLGEKSITSITFFFFLNLFYILFCRQMLLKFEH